MDNIEEQYATTMNNNNDNNTISKSNSNRSNSNNYNAGIMQRADQRRERGQVDLMRTAFEYTFPTNDDDDDDDDDDADDDDDDADDDNDDNYVQNNDNNDDNDDNREEQRTESDTTPYYTPMEFIASAFNFPSPKLNKKNDENIKSPLQMAAATAKVTTTATTASAATDITHHIYQHNEYSREDANGKGHIDNPSSTTQKSPRIMTNAFVKSNTATTVITTTTTPIVAKSTSPAINRRFRRFSLYERRSCSPQHMNIKNVTSTNDDCSVEIDKENAKPKFLADYHKDECKSDHNSPDIILDESNSPRIATNAEAVILTSSRFLYSPKLLNTLNNMNINSPLSVLSSVGYKNGNYFKFPEIDQGAALTSSGNLYQPADDVNDQKRVRPSPKKYHNIGNISPATLQHQQQSVIKTATSEIEANSGNAKYVPSHISRSYPHSDKMDAQRSHTNKNNLTIKIANSTLSVEHKKTTREVTETIPTTKATKTLTTTTTTTTASPAMQARTPTIKSIKEKALSLDSAGAASELRRGTRNAAPAQLSTSFDEMDSHLPETKSSIMSEHLCSGDGDFIKLRSTSLSPLASSSNLFKSNTMQSSYLVKNVRRRMSTLTSNDWPRKQHPYNVTTSLTDTTKTPKLLQKLVEDKTPIVILKEENEVGASITQTICPTTNRSSAIAASGTSTLRTSHKHNPLLHSSSTNLKTLPEFLTLVEFSTATTLPIEQLSIKQKSVDIPRSTSAKGARPSINTSSSTNLLQRRGSNHSLTLNLHSSCSNLLGNYRTGLSISNYNIGSITTSTTNLNSKSSDNINISNGGKVKPNTITITKNISTSLSQTNQGTKQSLFRRRGSNHSLTLANLTATSCSNLNSFSSQSSLNADKPPIVTLQRPSVTNTPRRGLLERRGSNQNLTLNTSTSFGGLSMERSILGHSRLHLAHSQPEEYVQHPSHIPSASMIASNHHQNQRKFYSSENLNHTNTQFADLNQTHRRNANQVCFGSVADLQVSNHDQHIDNSSYGNNIKEPTPRSFHHFDFQGATMCTCTGIRNIQTKPLSPQTTSEEFKVYLANIQMLQNASNALNQTDLIKLNYIFDNSYSTASFKNLTEQQSLPILNVPPNHHAPISDCETKSLTVQTHETSEDCEIQQRYLKVVQHILDTLRPDDEEQKRIFRNLYKEFWDLPLNHQEKPMVFGSQTKNRYKSILPNENSRVILEKESKFLQELYQICENDSENDFKKYLKNFDAENTTFSLGDEQPYINANYIKGPDYNSKGYIATQGPLPNTTFEFWLMIYQNIIKYMKRLKYGDDENPSDCFGQAPLKQYCQKIIMLTNFVESNRQKCSVYLPIELNDLIVITNKEEATAPTVPLQEFLEQYFRENSIMECEAVHHVHGQFRYDDDQAICMKNFKINIPEHLHSSIPRTNTFFIIKNLAIVKKNGFSIRKLSLLHCVNVEDDHQLRLIVNRFLCHHYWYPDWPDHRSPKDINTLLDIALHVLNLGKCETEFETFTHDNVTSPYAHIMAQDINLYQQDIFNAVQPLPVIHCSAGIGRTGCLTAILNGIRQVRQSLVYSLTSMAAAANTKRDSLGPILSPVDFTLPKSFLAQYTNANNTNATTSQDHILENLCQDIDCSFTYNTLLYLHYIIQINHNKPSEASNYKDSEELKSLTTLSLSQLPRMPNIFVDILGIVCNLRLQRGGMVQNSEQYELIHRAICLYLKRTLALKRF